MEEIIYCNVYFVKSCSVHFGTILGLLFFFFLR